MLAMHTRPDSSWSATLRNLGRRGTQNMLKKLFFCAECARICSPQAPVLQRALQGQNIRKGEGPEGEGEGQGRGGAGRAGTSLEERKVQGRSPPHPLQTDNKRECRSPPGPAHRRMPLADRRQGLARAEEEQVRARESPEPPPQPTTTTSRHILTHAPVPGLDNVGPEGAARPDLAEGVQERVARHAHPCSKKKPSLDRCPGPPAWRWERRRAAKFSPPHFRGFPTRVTCTRGDKPALP